MKLTSRFLRTALLALLASTPALAAPEYTVVADHLVSSRGLAFVPNGRLYVAQAGDGGMSGKITEIAKPASEDPIIRDVVTGLISLGDEGEFMRRFSLAETASIDAQLQILGFHPLLQQREGPSSGLRQLAVAELPGFRVDRGERCLDRRHGRADPGVPGSSRFPH